MFTHRCLFVWSGHSDLYWIVSSCRADIWEVLPALPSRSERKFSPSMGVASFFSYLMCQSSWGCLQMLSLAKVGISLSLSVSICVCLCTYVHGHMYACIMEISWKRSFLYFISKNMSPSAHVLSVQQFPPLL